MHYNTRSDLNKRIIKVSENKFNQRLVTRYLMQIKYGNSRRFNIDKAKEKLFIQMSKITVKAVNNFFSLVRKNEKISEERVVHTEEDIISECYAVLDNCVANVRTDKMHMFSFYYNSALNRAMFRIYSRLYDRMQVLSNDDEIANYKMNNIKSTHQMDMTCIDLQKFTPDEMLVIEGKMKGLKLKEFLEESGMLTQTYYETLDSVKTKLMDIYKDELIIQKINKRC